MSDQIVRVVFDGTTIPGVVSVTLGDEFSTTAIVASATLTGKRTRTLEVRGLVKRPIARKLELAQAQKDFTELAKRAKEQNFDQEMGEQVFLGLAMTYQKTGKKEQAQKAVEEGLGLYPQSEQLRKFQEQLRNNP